MKVRQFRERIVQNKNLHKCQIGPVIGSRGRIPLRMNCLQIKLSTNFTFAGQKIHIICRCIPCQAINKAVRQSPDLLFIATSFWFEESPCAVRTNTVGLGRLCTLFVCSTLLVFEHTHAVLSSTLVLCCTMVTTSTAAMSKSRYADTDRMKNVFLIRFSKPHLYRTKAGS